jgi:hypothetical protein
MRSLDGVQEELSGRIAGLYRVRGEGRGERRAAKVG